MEAIQANHLTIVSMAAAGGLLLLQLLVADIAGLKNPHIPGAPVPADHKNFWFRATRSLGNMNESIGIFILFAVAGILSGADPLWLGRCAAVYVIARTAYMLCYWFNIQMVRSIFFGVSLLALLGMGIVMTGGLLH